MSVRRTIAKRILTSCTGGASVPTFENIVYRSISTGGTVASPIDGIKSRGALLYGTSPRLGQSVQSSSGRGMNTTYHFSRSFSIIPSSWGIGGSKKLEESQENSEEDHASEMDMDQLSTSAAATGADDLVNLTEIAEKAALEAAMEGSWLPTRTLQWILETVHHGSGLAWWQSIMLTTVGIRAATFPIMLMQIKNTYRLSQARPEIENLVARLKEEQARGNPNATADYQQQVMKVWQKYNANPLKSMASIFVQAPLLIGFFSALRGLAAAKVPSMVEGGTLWFHDLTVADPTYALPLISAGTFLLMIELNAADGMEGQTDKMRSRFKNIMRGVAVLIVPFTVDLPAGVFMYWTASNMVSLVQSTVLKIPSVKKTFGIPNLQKIQSSAASTPAATGSAAATPTIPAVTFTQKPKAKKRSTKRPAKTTT